MVYCKAHKSYQCPDALQRELHRLSTLLDRANLAAHVNEQRATACAEVERLRAENERLRAALERIEGILSSETMRGDQAVDDAFGVAFETLADAESRT